MTPFSAGTRRLPPETLVVLEMLHKNSRMQVLVLKFRKHETWVRTGCVRHMAGIVITIQRTLEKQERLMKFTRKLFCQSRILYEDSWSSGRRVLRGVPHLKPRLPW